MRAVDLLNEKCWPGYQKKGMKTMFGKRVPNCVKKESLEESEITSQDLQQLETYADKLFASLGIDVSFSKHFRDRVNDPRNNKPITMAELTRLFKQTYKQHGKPIAQLGPDAEAVMKDMKTDVNVPFALELDGQELDLVAKTIMRKPNFATSNLQFAVESAVTDLEKGLVKLDKVSYNPIDKLMKKIAKDHDITPKELHNKFKSKHDMIPDAWAKNKVEEKITKRTPMGDVVKDFYKSDAPQFKGKSKAKRRQMAIAAKLSKMDEAIDKFINENFADGKVKGKSRPGRVKKAGASCKGSVTSLRAKAKKASGEKAKMYHWCANMKSGKKK